MEHSGGVRDWSAAAIAKQRVDLSEFERSGKTCTRTAGGCADGGLPADGLRHCARSLGIGYKPRWQRDPAFYVEQTVGAMQEELWHCPAFLLKVG